MKRTLLLVIGIIALISLGCILLLHIDNTSSPLASDQTDKNTTTPADITAEVEQYHYATFLEYDDSVMTTIQVKHGNTISDIPTPQWEDGIFISWYRVNNGEELTPYTLVLEDVTYEPQWIYVPFLVQNGEALSGIDLNSLTPNELEALISKISSLTEE